MYSNQDFKQCIQKFQDGRSSSNKIIYAQSRRWPDLTVWTFMLFTLLLNFPKLTHAQTRVSGEVSGEWTVEDHPYFIDVEAVVPEGETLTIQAGVDVYLGRYIENGRSMYDTLRIQGQLIVNGSPDDSVHFYEDTTPWHGNGVILFEVSEDADTSRLNYALFAAEMHVMRSQFVLTNSSFQRTTIRGHLLRFITISEDERGGGGIVENCEFLSSRITATNSVAVFRDCNIINGDIQIYGDSDVLVERCYGEDNGVSYFSGATGIVRDCELRILGASGNYPYPITDPLIENCSLQMASFGGDSCRATMRNCLIVGQGAGISVADSAAPLIENNTISASTGLRITYIYGPPITKPIIRNNLFMHCNNGYKVDVFGDFLDPEDLNIDYNILWDVYAARVGVNALGEHDRTIDPQLRGAPQYRYNWDIDYRLTAGSPAIDSGDPESGMDPDGTRKDIGAYFYDQNMDHPPSVISPRDYHSVDGDTLRYWAKVIDDGDEVGIEMIGLPEWLEIAPRRDLALDSVMIFGLPPLEMHRDSFRIVAIDSEEQTDTLSVFVTIDHSPLFGSLSGTLTRENSPYTVIDSIIVEAGDTLVIEPGVTIRFNKHEHLFLSPENNCFSVYGVLLCEGTEEDSIYFTSNQPYPAKRDWDGVEIEGEGSVGSKISYTNFLYADHDNLDVINSSIEITHNRFAFAGGTGLAVRNMAGAVEYNLFHNNGSGFGMGTDQIDNPAPIRNNIVTRNDNGFGYSGQGALSPVPALIENNIIIDNSGGVNLSGFCGLFQNNIIMYNGYSEEGWARDEENGLSIQFQMADYEFSFEVKNNLIADNHSGVSVYVFADYDYNYGIISNNTIANNSEYGMRLGTLQGDVFARNNVILGGRYGFRGGNTREDIRDDVDYNLVWGSVYYDFVFANFENDDPFANNISEDPEFFGIEPYTYRLNSNSPAIDSGDPEFDNDPDGTRADMGYHYYNQNNSAPLIRGFEPQDTILAVTNVSEYFSIDVSDDDEMDSLVYRWFHSGLIVGSDPEIDIVFPDTGNCQLSVVVMDGTDADSVSWTVLVSPNSIIVESKPPIQYALHSPYPNPFNSVAMIPYELPEQSELQIDLFDLMGRRVESLYNGQKAAGHHRLLLKASGLASGVYVVRMTTPKFQKSMRIVQIK